ncbi:tolB protein [Polyangium jinanense]|uniref:PD40 domain-containing protein n=1 Tax=Polyangium jinanense TaxID=2829994 RepID=A0A9X3WYT8_9BACT|nr:tolB protein [Polyangium jinanense]MDC3953424.1 PD40 domain-containing protein [Polyangium jinanense]MDC3979455.1 PD40 domain-containing protein [Polyangium jinanense]
MRLKKTLLALAAVSSVSVAAFAEEPAPAETPPSPEDLLGNIVVVAGATRPLPRIAVLPSSSWDEEDVIMRSVARRDLELSGEFEVLTDDDAPEEAWGAETLDVSIWAKKKVEALVEARARPVPGQDKVELRARVYFVRNGAGAVLDKRFLIPASELREEAHRISDLVIGALTGQNGGFASRMTFVAGVGKLRRVFTVDADGHDPKPVSPTEEIAVAPAFGKGDELYWAASAQNGEYRIRTASGRAVDLPIKGSVYGLAFSRDKSRVAVSIADGGTIKMFVGPDFAGLSPASEVGMALRPTFTPSGNLAYSGEGRFGQRIYVDDKPISPDGLFATAPTFCNHPDGVRAVYAVGVGKDTDLVSTDERGRGMVRLTQGQGRNGYPACSPDGRLVAFFSTRTSGEGPGLYVMRLDGGRPKRISTLVGDSLRWDPLPPGRGVELKNEPKN